MRTVGTPPGTSPWRTGETPGQWLDSLAVVGVHHGMTPHFHLDQIIALATLVGGRIVGAVVLWVVGRMIIRGLLRLTERGFLQQKLEATLIRYLNSAIRAVLNMLLVIAVLGVFGVQTTTFAGILAAAGVAIGLAWSGLLSNFAAGIFMMMLRPFKTGDFVSAAGVTGTVHSIGLFATEIDTPDNVRTFVGNAKVFTDTIQNFSANGYRRVDLTAQLAHGVSPDEAIRLLRARVAGIAHVLASPAPVVEVLEFTPSGPVLAVRPFCHNDHYWDVYFATNRAIVDEFGKAGFPVPEQHRHVRTAALVPVSQVHPIVSVA